MNITNTEVNGFYHAVKGIRNNRNTWDKSDSIRDNGEYIIGKDDFKLMCKLAIAGNAHSKFMRYITVYCDIEAPIYWWKEFDTYKVGTVRNSTSTMNTIMNKEFELSDFENIESPSLVNSFNDIINSLNNYRSMYLDIKSRLANDMPKDEMIAMQQEQKEIWYSIIKLLPSSYKQTSTILMNYQVLRHIYFDRKDHKLNEWHIFCDWIKTLPDSEIITCTSVDETLKNKYTESSSFSHYL